MRQDDAEWWDQDADALHWIFDTTAVDADLGVAHQFSNYRSDGLKLPPAQKDRTYLFGNLGGQWMPGLPQYRLPRPHGASAAGSWAPAGPDPPVTWSWPVPSRAAGRQTTPIV